MTKTADSHTDQTIKQFRITLGDLQITFLGQMIPLTDDYSDIHYHTTTEFQYFTAGSAQILSGDTAYTASAGDLIIIPAGTLHRNSGQDDHFSRLAFSIALQKLPCDSTSAGFSEYLHYSTLFSAAESPCVIHVPELTEIIDRLIQCSVSETLSHRVPLLLAQIFCDAADVVYLTAQEQSTVKPRGESIPTVDGQIRRHLIEYFICTSYMKPNAADLLMEELHLSRRQTDRIVRACMGESLNSLLIRQRMNAAQVLLRYTERPITVIAEEVGYTSYVGFYSAFKKHVGISPDAYRQQYLL